MRHNILANKQKLQQCNQQQQHWKTSDGKLEEVGEWEDQECEGITKSHKEQKIK